MLCPATGGVQCIRELKLAQEVKDPYKVVFIDYRVCWVELW